MNKFDIEMASQSKFCLIPLAIHIVANNVFATFETALQKRRQHFNASENVTRLAWSFKGQHCQNIFLIWSTTC